MPESLSFCKIEKARNCLQNSGLEKSKTADKLLACPPSVNIRLCRSSILHFFHSLNDRVISNYILSEKHENSF